MGILLILLAVWRFIVASSILSIQNVFDEDATVSDRIVFHDSRNQPYSDGKVLCISSVLDGYIRCDDILGNGDFHFDRKLLTEYHFSLWKQDFTSVLQGKLGGVLNSNNDSIAAGFDINSLTRHHRNTSLQFRLPNINIASALIVRILGTGQDPIELNIENSQMLFTLHGLQPGSFVCEAKMIDRTGSVVGTEKIFFEAMLNMDEVISQRLIPSSMEHLEISPYRHMEADMQNRQPKIRLCFVGGLKLDGQKSIWLEQFHNLSSEAFDLTYLTYVSQSELDEETSILVLNKLRSLNISIIQIQLPSIGLEELKADDIYHDPFRPSIAVQIVDRMLSLLKSGRDVPPWGRDWWISLKKGFAASRPDIVIFANGREELISDALLVKAAHLNMKHGGVVIMELPNLYPDVRVEADVLIAPSLFAATHKSIKDYLEHHQQSKIYVIPPGTNLSRFEPNGKRICHPHCRHLSYLEGSFEKNSQKGKCHFSCKNVGFLARLAPEKSLGLFLMSASIIVKKLPFTRFTVIGSGELAGEFKHLAGMLRIGSIVDFVGAAYGDLPDRLRGFDLLVNPSLRSESETFCIANIEAMAAGVPVVSFGIGGIGEYLRHGQNGWLVDDPAPESLAREVIHLLEDDELREQIGKAARKSVEDGFSSTLQMSRYEMLYMNIFHSFYGQR